MKSILMLLISCRYPPGHGDVFPAFANSGKLDELIAQVRTKLDSWKQSEDHDWDAN